MKKKVTHFPFYSSKDNNLNFSILKNEIQRSFTFLKKREIEILRRRYGLDGYKRCTLKEVGREFNITAERVRQIQAHALKKLLNNISFHDLQDYIPL